MSEYKCLLPTCGTFLPPPPPPSSAASCRVRIVGNSSFHAGSEVWFINYSSPHLFSDEFYISQRTSVEFGEEFDFWISTLEFMCQLSTPRPGPDVGGKLKCHQFCKRFFFSRRSKWKCHLRRNKGEIGTPGFLPKKKIQATSDEYVFSISFYSSLKRLK